MFGIGGFELFIILLFAFLIFGPEKLPDIARTIGRAIAKFRTAQQEMNETLKGTDLYDPNNPDGPFKDPLVALEKLAKNQDEGAKASSGAEAGASAAPAAAPEAAASAVAAGADAAATDEPRRESFTERKARYERERAARKAAAEAEAAAAEQPAEPAEKAEEAAAAEPVAADAAEPVAAPAAEPAASAEPAAEQSAAATEGGE